MQIFCTVPEFSLGFHFPVLPVLVFGPFPGKYPFPVPPRANPIRNPNAHGSSVLCTSQIGSPVVKAFALQADGLGFNSPAGYKVGRPGHSKYVWVG